MPSDFDLVEQTTITMGDLGIKWGWPKITIGKFKLSLKPPEEVREWFSETAEGVVKAPAITPVPTFEPSIFQKSLPLIIISALALGGFIFYRKRRRRRRR